MLKRIFFLVMLMAAPVAMVACGKSSPGSGSSLSSVASGIPLPTQPAQTYDMATQCVMSGGYMSNANTCNLPGSSIQVQSSWRYLFNVNAGDTVNLHVSGSASSSTVSVALGNSVVVSNAPASGSVGFTASSAGPVYVATSANTLIYWLTVNSITITH